MRCRFRIILLIHVMVQLVGSSVGFADSLETLEFFPDAKEQSISLPDSLCSILIDDDSNYLVERIEPDKIKLIGVGITDRSATLLLDCPGTMIVYALRFVSRRKYGVDVDGSQRLGQTDSYLAISAGELQDSVLGVNFEMTDRSLREMQVSIRQNFPTGTMNGARSDSIDIAHEGTDWRFSYGFEKSIRVRDPRLNYRGSLGLYGFSAIQTYSQLPEGHEYESASLLRLPSPLNLSLAYKRDREGTTLRTADRFIGGSLGFVAMSALARYEKELKAGMDVRENLSVKIDETLVSSFSVRPSNSNSIECSSKKKCLLKEWVIRSMVNITDSSVSLDYGLLPHSMAIAIQSKVGRRSYTTFQARKYFKRKSFVNRWRFASKDGATELTSESSAIHLEFGAGQWTYFANQNASLFDRNLSGSSVGVRFDGGKLIASANISRPRLTNGPWGFAADVRYFFDHNLRAGALHATKTKIDVNVMSNAGGKPISDVFVRLLKDKQHLATRVSSLEGRALFTEARCCTEYEVQVRHGEKTVSEIVRLAGDSLEKSVSIYVIDHRRVRVDFFVESVARGREKINLQNYFSEIGEAIISHPASTAHNANSFFVPMSGAISLTINEHLLPFGFRLVTVTGGDVDTSTEGTHVVNVILSEK